MRKNKRAWSGLALASVMLVAGCTSGNQTDKESATPAPSTAVATATASVAPTPAKPVSIKMFSSDYGKPAPDMKSTFVTYMEQKTNTDLNISFLPHAQYPDQLKLKFASGDFPDVYQSWSGPEADLIASGKILELNDLIDKYGPNLKKYIPQASWDAVTVNGKILAVPQPNPLSGSVLYIRKDWLDKLGLQVPKTSDELLTVLRAFRDNDPNGNGKKDEIPFTMREMISWGENLFGMWGVNTQWHEMYVNNQVQFANIQPNMKTALGFMNTLYKEKLLDSEFLTNSKAVEEQKIKSGLVGMWNHAPSLAQQWQQDVAAGDKAEQVNVIAIPTPVGAGYSGPVGTKWNPVNKTFILFKSAKDPVAIIKYLDWLMSDEGQIFTGLGIEGDTYKKDGSGNIVFDPNRQKDIQFLSDIFQMTGYNETVLKAGTTPEAFAKIKVANDIVAKEGFPNEAVGMPPIANDRNMGTMFQEAAAKIILGNSPIDSWDTFVASWKKQGGDDLMKDRTDWYNQNRKK
ncbi:hypothetical protein A8709_17535 [Paenibacillus pectinilyticus]|uniref:ABC transporter substrate-binding protein n=1 Tax=Paenibacillus pectinilyticus TaxID=512399 RepID=A0A1C0ZZ51_9BACL|nr:extracellular solute-binding protein [Paenibacillus pectinilyticus]OCT13413.1 hypothetical protein A8709_17535 [Paenibacillus pectinilyticus]